MAKLSISKAWDETRDALARDGKLFVAVALALFVLPGVVAEVAQPNAPAGEFPPMGYWTVLSFLALIISLVGQLAVILLAIGKGQRVGDTIAQAARRSPTYIAATILWIAPFAIVITILIATGMRDPQNPSPAALLALLPLMILMLFVAVRMLLTSSVAAAEGAGPIAIIKRSWELTHGNWWRLFGFFLLYIIAAVILLLAVQSVIGSLVALAFGELGPFTVGRLLLSVVNQLLGAALSTVFMVMLARLYVQAVGPRGEDMVEVFR